MTVRSLFEFNFDNKQTIKLTADIEKSIDIVNFSTITIEEHAGLASTVLTVNMIDGIGNFLGQLNINHNTDFNLIFGKDDINVNTIKYRLASQQLENGHAGKSMSILTSLSFISNNWSDFILTNKSNSWINKKYSDIVIELIEKNSLIPDVEPTKGSFTVIQPYWSDFKLLQWIVMHAVNNKENGDYFFGTTLDNKFIFRSMDDIFSNRPICTFVLSDVDKKDDDDDKQYFRAFLVKNDYAKNSKSSISGIDSTYYDFLTGSFVTETINIDQLQQRQINDYVGIDPSHTNSHNQMYGGLDVNSSLMHKNEMLFNMNRMLRMTISIDGNFDMHIGSLVNIVIPANLAHIETVFEEYYSGYWCIEHISHIFNLKEGVVITNLTLIRSGINSSQNQSYSKTTRGKQIVQI